MELKPFTGEMEVVLDEAPDVTFICTRPRLEELGEVNNTRRLRTMWSNNVKNWTGLDMDGVEFPCTPENKKKLIELNSLLVMAVCNKLAANWNQEFKQETGN
tara:strand:- start:156 stop:461 length:306 start_codon:yes stop_codon:yes gene_type:complete